MRRVKILTATFFIFLIFSAPCRANDFLETLKSNANKGDDEAQYTLGFLYSTGKGVSKDNDTAIKWYTNGQGAAKNIDKAVKLYLKAAEKGFKTALHNLGLLYYEGEGVPRDYIKAYAFWSIAAPTYVQSKHNQQILKTKMSPDQIAEGKKETEILREKHFGSSIEEIIK